MPDLDDALKPLDAFVGEWDVEGSLPGVRGWTGFEWLQGGGFLIQRSTVEPEEFPNSISIIGADEAGGYAMHYFDSRGVARVYAMSLDDRAWTLAREPSGPRSDFWQRWIGEFSEDGKTITGRWEKSDDGTDWEVDFHLTYARD